MSQAEQNQGGDAAQPRDPKRRHDYEGQAKFERGLLRRLLELILPERGLVIAALILFPLVAGVQLVQPIVLKQAIDGPIKAGEVSPLAYYAGVYFALILFHALLQYVQAIVMQLVGQRVMKDVRTKLFRRVVTLAPSYFDKTPQGRIMTRLTGDVANLNEFISSGLVSVIADTVLLLGIVAVMLYMDWRLALISFALVLPLIGAIAWLRGRIRQLYRAIRNRNTALNTYLNESIIGMVIVQAFTREERSASEFKERNYGVWREQLRGVTLSSSLSAAVQLAKVLSLALLFWAALTKVFGITASLGLIVAFVDYVDRFYAPVDNLSGRYTILQTAMAAAEKVFTLLDTQEELAQPQDPTPVPELSGAVHLDNVRFQYATGEEVLHGVDLEIKRGQTLALVGATGAGKSTIVKLLGRFYDPSGGAVRWDGHDLRDFNLQDLRRRIAYVPQQTFLFSDTLGHNIALGPGREEQAKAAAEAVRADSIAKDLPEGYDQLLGERGHDLSAGERQLVSFARALASDPELLILDEATANIDGETEERIQQALETLLADRTAVVIAHRLSTIKQADQIVVLHKGRVAERGRHDELLEQRGLYWKLYRLQSEEAA